jgi:outer membrane protein TolC
LFATLTTLPVRQQAAARSFGAFAIVALFLTQSALAADGEALSLDEALRVGVERSPVLAAQRSAIVAAEQSTLSARELPDPKLFMGVDNLPIDGPDRYSVGREFMTMRKIGVMQEFPRTEKRELKSERAKMALSREEASLADTRASLRRDIAQVWVERYFAERMAAVVAEQFAETQLQRDALQAGVRAGKVQASEVLGLDVGLQSLLDRQADFDKQAVRARIMLSRWLGPAAGRPLAAMPDSLSPGEHAESSTHVSDHPHLQTMERQVGIAQTEAALARASKKPDWSLEANYAQRGSSFSNMVSVQVTIDLPIFQSRRQDPDIAAKMALVEQAQALKEDTMRQHVAEADAAWSDWEAASRRLKRFDQSLLPLARQRTHASLAAYSGGQGTLAAVLDARRSELELKLQQLQLAADQARAYAQLLYFLPEENAK